MEVFVAGQEILVSVAPPLDNVTGQEIEATAVTLNISDKTGNIIYPNINLTAVNGVYEYIMTPAQTTTTDKTDLRVCTFSFHKSNGSFIKVVERFIIEAATLLTPMENSFINYDEALLIANYLPDIDDFLSAEEPQQKAALINSYNKISALYFAYTTTSNNIERADYLYGGTTYITEMRNESIEDFNNYPSDFREALKTAQILQANYIISGNEAEDRRRDGIVSETIGEAKMFFNNRPPLRSSLCKAAMEVLGRYIYRKTMIGRA